MKEKTSDIIKKELKIAKGSGKSGIYRVADISQEQVKGVALAKFGSESEQYLKQVMGTCRSMGISIGVGPVSEEEAKKATTKEEAVTAPAEAQPAAPVAPAPVEKKEEKKRKIRKGK